MSRERERERAINTEIERVVYGTRGLRLLVLPASKFTGESPNRVWYYEGSSLSVVGKGLPYTDTLPIVIESDS